jgi:hypothetical protein
VRYTPAHPKPLLVTESYEWLALAAAVYISA